MIYDATMPPSVTVYFDATRGKPFLDSITPYTGFLLFVNSKNNTAATSVIQTGVTLQKCYSVLYELHIKPKCALLQQKPLNSHRQTIMVNILKRRTLSQTSA